jgi:hypothetical protein
MKSQSLGRSIKRAVEQEMVTVKQLAAESGVSVASIYRIMQSPRCKMRKSNMATVRAKFSELCPDLGAA